MPTAWGPDPMSARRNLIAANLGFMALWLAVMGLGLYTTHRFRYEADWTVTGRNSLAPPSLTVVRQLKGPVFIQAFAPPGTTRHAIRVLIGQYQRVNGAIHLQFIDPNKHPGAVRRNNISYNGELRIRYGHRQATVVTPSQSAITNTLFSLERTGLRNLVFLAGNGERSPLDTAPYGLSAWAGELRDRGFTVSTHNIGDGPLPQPGTAVVVIADPRSRFLPGEVARLTGYVQAGGNLIWLLEPGHVEGLTPLAQTLGLRVAPGFLVDPASSLLTGDMPNFITVDHYPAVGPVHDMHLITVFPTAAALTLKPQGPFRKAAILRTAGSAWLQSAPLGNVITPPRGGKSRPYVLGATFTQTKGTQTSRAVVIGDSDFAANTYLGEGGNLALAMNIANWVANDEAFINMPNRTSPDLTLRLSQDELSVIAFGFMVVLPLVFAGNGILVWWRRRNR
ncbi:MAG: GldG family protein [Gammaproteobacteria bacterium]|nr:GldG family protein [Gammaproteobacteria bacterium]